MTQKSIVLLILSGLLALTSCSDNDLIDGNKPAQEQDQLGAVHVNDLGEEHWETDPNKQHKLFAVVCDPVNDCQGLLEIENQMAESECQKVLEKREVMANEPRDYTSEDLKKMFGVDREPVKGVTRITTIEKEVTVETPVGPQAGTEKESTVNWFYLCKKSEAEVMAAQNECGLVGQDNKKPITLCTK